MFTNFVCRQSKAGKNGLSPIELSIIIDGKRKYITLERRIKASDFNSKKQSVRKDEETNTFLELVRNKCYSIENDLMKMGIPITV